MTRANSEANTMANFKKMISKVRFVRRRSGKWTIIAIIIAIVLSMGALTALHLSMSQLKNRTEDLRDKAAQLEAENEDLQEDIEQVDSIQGIVEIAEKELGLAQPDAVFYGEEP